jgi:hypothetical protein
MPTEISSPIGGMEIRYGKVKDVGLLSHLDYLFAYAAGHFHRF